MALQPQDYEYSLQCAKRDLSEYKQLGNEHYLVLSPYDEKTCPKCRELSGIPLPVSKANIGVNFPPFGPNCRGTTTMAVEGCISYEHLFSYTRLFQRRDGSFVKLPAHMSYSEWTEWKTSGEPNIDPSAFYRKYITRYPFMRPGIYNASSYIRKDDNGGIRFMKTRKFFMNLLGIVLILISLFPLGLFIVSLQGEMEASAVASVVGGLLFIGILVLSGLCFRVSRRIVIPQKNNPASSTDDRYPNIDVTDLDSSIPTKYVSIHTNPAPKPSKPGFWANFQVDYVLIANSSSRTKAGSAIGRGIVGGALLGPVGLLAAASAKKNSYLDLIVHYKSGRVATQRVKINSVEYRSLAPYIRA